MVTDTDWRTENERRIYLAAGFTPGDLDEPTRNVVTWLAGWDDHTVNAVVKLLAGGWEDLIACVCPEGDTLALCRVHGLDYDEGANR